MNLISKTLTRVVSSSLYHSRAAKLPTQKWIISKQIRVYSATVIAGGGRKPWANASMKSPEKEFAPPKKIEYKPEISNWINLIGFVEQPVQFGPCSEGKFWAGTVISQRSGSKSSNFWIPIIFEGDLAQIAAKHVKKEDRIHISGKLFIDSPPPNVTYSQSNVQTFICKSIKLQKNHKCGNNREERAKLHGTKMQHTLNNTTGSQDPDPNPNLDPDQFTHRNQNHPQSRRPRGFAVAAAASINPTESDVNNGNIGGGEGSSGGGGGKGKREREKEKERTKLRERHRRAITSRMLAGLRQYGNFPLPARADMNDVIAALAREAGWSVDADGTTYRQSHQPNHAVQYPTRSIESPLSSSTLKNCAKAALECQQHSVLRIDENLSPVSLDSVVIAESDHPGNGRYTGASPITSVGCLEPSQLIQDVHSTEPRNDFTQSFYVPVYSMLPVGIIDSFGQLVDPEGVRQELSYIKSLNVDGVVIDCWWGIVEGWNPQKYVWSGYRELFNLIRDFKLKLQVVMAFHEYGGNASGNVMISLPQWVLEIGKENPDIFFTDREGRRNFECLNWSIDKERVLHGRTGIEVYFDFMRSFRSEFDDLFVEGLIAAVEIGLGASGELKYPAFPERMGWIYPGIGEFQCYDKYSQSNLLKEAKSRGFAFWGKGPENAGQYNSQAHETGFFQERGEYDSYYGRFFLNWYSQLLISHAENVLSLANLAFEETKIIVKIPAIYWSYKTASHAAELTAGYYNPSNRDGYSLVFETLKKYSVTVKFVCPGPQMSPNEHEEALADPEGLSWQVVNAAWDKGLLIGGENMITCFDRESCMRLIDIAKPRNHPDSYHFSFFTYRQPSPLVQGSTCFPDLDYFIKHMHGDIQR